MLLPHELFWNTHRQICTSNPLLLHVLYNDRSCLHFQRAQLTQTTHTLYNQSVWHHQPKTMPYQYTLDSPSSSISSYHSLRTSLCETRVSEGQSMAKHSALPSFSVNTFRTCTCFVSRRFALRTVFWDFFLAWIRSLRKELRRACMLLIRSRSWHIWLLIFEGLWTARLLLRDYT